jgi:S1-C subfamily serine protease
LYRPAAREAGEFAMRAAVVLTLAVLAPLAAGDVPKPVRDRAAAATVKVVSPADVAEGSGVLVGRNGPLAYLLTANHVVAKAKTAEVRVRVKGMTRPYPAAEVLARSADADLAVLRFTAGGELPAPLQLLPASAKADPFPLAAVSVGWVKGDAPAAADETVRAKVRIRKPGETASAWHWETAGRPTPGRSGGPLVDAAGRLLGVANGHDDKAGYYAHADEIHAFLKRSGLGWLAAEDDR